MKTFSTVVIAAGLLGGLGNLAHAGLVTNGGFETGTIAGWTDGGNTGWNTVATSPVHSGSFAISNGAVGSESLLSQLLPTSAGTSYIFDYWVRTDGGGSVVARWNGVNIAGTLISAASGGLFVHLTGSVVGTGSDTLTIASRDDPGFNYFDDIDVNAITASTPEPATFSLLGFGLVGALALSLRRRRA